MPWSGEEEDGGIPEENDEAVFGYDVISAPQWLDLDQHADTAPQVQHSNWYAEMCSHPAEGTISASEAQHAQASHNGDVETHAHQEDTDAAIPSMGEQHEHGENATASRCTGAAERRKEKKEEVEEMCEGEHQYAEEGDAQEKEKEKEGGRSGGESALRELENSTASALLPPESEQRRVSLRNSEVGLSAAYWKALPFGEHSRRSSVLVDADVAEQAKENVRAVLCQQEGEGEEEGEGEGEGEGEEGEGQQKGEGAEGEEHVGGEEEHEEERGAHDEEGARLHVNFLVDQAVEEEAAEGVVDRTGDHSRVHAPFDMFAPSPLAHRRGRASASATTLSSSSSPSSFASSSRECCSDQESVSRSGGGHGHRRTRGTSQPRRIRRASSKLLTTPVGFQFATEARARQRSFSTPVVNRAVQHTLTHREPSIHSNGSSRHNTGHHSNDTRHYSNNTSLTLTQPKPFQLHSDQRALLRSEPRKNNYNHRHTSHNNGSSSRKRKHTEHTECTDTDADPHGTSAASPFVSLANRALQFFYQTPTSRRNAPSTAASTGRKVCGHMCVCVCMCM
jgi:hypothetical protein